jgi:guanine deaminase
MDGAFRAAEAHGIRAILGKVMMDRMTYDERIDPSTILERSIAESEELCRRWHGADGGRLGYAVTPRFAVSCTAEMLRESAELAARTGSWRLFPEALDYVDVYDRAGGLGQRAVLAHAIHLSDRELGRLVETGTRVAHCPASNLFLASGVMPLARYLEAGLAVGLGFRAFLSIPIGCHSPTARHASSTSAAWNIACGPMSTLPFALASKLPNGSCTRTSLGLGVAQS